jgi:hypothetical protein
MQAGLSGLMTDELRASFRVRTQSALQMRANANDANFQRGSKPPYSGAFRGILVCEGIQVIGLS